MTIIITNIIGYKIIPYFTRSNISTVLIWSLRGSRQDVALINIPVDHLIDYLAQRSRGRAVISLCPRLPFHFQSGARAPDFTNYVFILTLPFPF